MRKNIVWAVLVIATALLETTLLDLVKVQGVVPDLTLLLVVFFAIVEGDERAMYTGLLGGVFQDVVLHKTLGHHVLGLVIIGYVVSRISIRLITEHPAVKMALVFGASIANGIIFTAVAYIQQPAISALHLLVTSVVPESFYTALVTPIAFFLLQLVFQRRYGAQGDFS
jgi:rod shape-determining protein MreD